MVFDCMEIVRDDIILAHSRCDDDAVDDDDARHRDDENEDDNSVGCEHHRHRYDRDAGAIESDDDAWTLLSFFIASVSRCCSLLHNRQMPIVPRSSSSSSSSLVTAAVAAASKPCYEVHDSVASSATRLLRRMVSMFPVRR
jgi:hypothetical protein